VWRPLDPARDRRLKDARLELHHAAQLVAGFGVSYLPHRDDDSHTNMEWLPALNALASNPVGDQALRLGVRPRNLNLLAIVGDAESSCFMLATRTLGEAIEWIRRTTAHHGLDAAAYALPSHYAIPPHPVVDGRPFDVSGRAEFEQLDAWFADAALLLERIAADHATASPVRCWPHHFDIATLIDVAPGRTIGVGLEPGDDYYDEPYWYVNLHPAPAANAAMPPLDGNGVWHTHEWIGAVLPASRLDAATEEQQSERFIRSAIDACRVLLALLPA
jgi:hypothetical protein